MTVGQQPTMGEKQPSQLLLREKEPSPQKERPDNPDLNKLLSVLPEETREHFFVLSEEVQNGIIARIEEEPPGSFERTFKQTEQQLRQDRGLYTAEEIREMNPTLREIATCAELTKYLGALIKLRKLSDISPDVQEISRVMTALWQNRGKSRNDMSLFSTDH